MPCLALGTMSDDLNAAGCGVFVIVFGSSLLLPFYPVVGIVGMFLGTILANHLYMRIHDNE
jgi:hypothetical protein